MISISIKNISQEDVEITDLQLPSSIEPDTTVDLIKFGTQNIYNLSVQIFNSFQLRTHILEGNVVFIVDNVQLTTNQSLDFFDSLGTNY